MTQTMTFTASSVNQWVLGQKVYTAR